MFNSLEMAPADPILGLNDAFNKDTNPQKINLGVGVYKNEDGIVPKLECIKRAEKLLVEHGSPSAYLPISGFETFNKLSVELLFGKDSTVIKQGHVAAVQTPGGTGGLRVAGDFIRHFNPNATVWVSDPTWANHNGVFGACGLLVDMYPYYDKSTATFSFEAMKAKLQEVKKGDVVVLHACCHNPSGMDPEVEQWKELAEIAKERGFITLFDCAYQGFGKGLEEDVQSIRIFAEAGLEMIVCASYSKNFGLYSQRIGSLSVVAHTADAAQTAISHVKSAVRANYSNPPAFGAYLVATILGDAELRGLWEKEVAVMRDRINGLRQKIADKMAERTDKRDFSMITRQQGMFSFSGLSKEEVDRLREEFAIYIVGSGRISIAGLNEGNLDYVCDAIAAVI